VNLKLKILPTQKPREVPEIVAQQGHFTEHGEALKKGVNGWFGWYSGWWMVYGLYLAAPKTDQKPDASGRRVMSAKMQPDPKCETEIEFVCVCCSGVLAKMVTMAAITYSHIDHPLSPR